MRNIVRRGGRAIGHGWRRLRCSLLNLRRRLLRQRLDAYVVLTLDREITERSPKEPWWYGYIPGRSSPLSLEALHDALQKIAADPAPKGVIFLVKNPALTLAQAQSLSALCQRFRDWDRQQHPRAEHKKICFHLEQISTPIYVAACVADQITATPLSSWDVLGLRTTPTFLQTTLAKLGIEMDVVQIAPWKSALDTFARSEISPEAAEQINWLFDSWYDDVVAAIATGRNKEPDAVKQLIDQGPWDASQALAFGLIDAVCYEDELPIQLGSTEQPAQLQRYGKIRGLLLRHPRPSAERTIGVLSLNGSIMPGKSYTQPIELPILGKAVVGSSTVQQQIRAARRDSSIGAVVLHVDSPGGSALASDLIWRELLLLQQEKPVVAYMGNVAASGGYYIAVSAQQIIAQRATLTGSIGVITGKAVTAGAYAKVGANRTNIQRGNHAGLYADDHHWTASERDKIEASITHVYEIFKSRVATGRNLPHATLDAVANGRVWTGRQAQAHQLIDEIGDFQCAVERACALAELPTDGSVQTRTISPPNQPSLAEPQKTLQELAGLEGTAQIGRLAETVLTERWQRLFGGERFWLLVDGLPRLQ